MALSASCSICSQLSDREYATQKFGWEENDTHLPGAASQLTDVKELKLESSRSAYLQRCPQCGTYYLYESDYEYLAGGSEDTQTLTRLLDEESTRYLEG